jgi:cilia- and flagella-associated protein 298
VPVAFVARGWRCAGRSQGAFSLARSTDPLLHGLWQNVKRGDKSVFLYETTVTQSCDDATRAVCAINNQRLRVVRLCQYCEELASHGPAKPPGKEGIDRYTNEDGSLKDGVDEDTVDLAAKYAHYNEDPQGQRTGDAPAPELAAVIRKQCAEAGAVVDTAQVEKRVCLTPEMIQAQIDLLRGAVTIAYPMGLPEYDRVAACLDDDEDLSGSAYGKDVLDPETSCLWWAGKQMLREGQTLRDYIGKNEKTKVVVKLQSAAGGAPTREPAIDEQTQKKMMAFYHKKQETMKALEEDDDDDYANSAWANPNALKNSFQGLGGGVSIGGGKKFL